MLFNSLNVCIRAYIILLRLAWGLWGISQINGKPNLVKSDLVARLHNLRHYIPPFDNTTKHRGQHKSHNI